MLRGAGSLLFGFPPMARGGAVLPASARGLRRIVDSYTGDALILRRSSDNAEEAFGFTSAGDLDTAAIAMWLGAADGYCTTLYDQRGGASATITIADNQPRYDASAIGGKPALYFDGANDLLEVPFANELLFGLSAMALSFVLRPDTLGTGRYLYSTDGGRARFGVNGTGLIVGLVDVGAYNAFNAGWFPADADRILDFVWDGDFKTVVNGEVKRTDAWAGTITPGGAWRRSYIGALSGSNEPTGFFHGHIAEIVLYDSGLDPTRLRAAQSAYYGVTIA